MKTQTRWRILSDEESKAVAAEMAKPAEEPKPEPAPVAEEAKGEVEQTPTASDVESTAKALEETKYPHTIYKGDVSELKTDGDGVSFFTRDKDAADYYTTSREQQGVSKGNKTFKGNIVTKNPLIVDANKPSPIELKDANGKILGIFGQGDYVQKVKDAGYDAIIVNRKFGTPLDGWEIVSFDRKQIVPKSESLLSKEQTSEQAPQAFPAQEGAESVEDKFQANSELEQIYRELQAAVNKNIDEQTLRILKANPSEAMIKKAFDILQSKGVIKIDCK
jgi:hypothetical protein